MRAAHGMKKRADTARQKRAATARRVWPLLIAGIAVILFSSAGFARMMGWGPGAGYSGASLALDVPAGEARAGPSCPECGMIVSVREIEERNEGSPPSYEFVVRMADGSSRVIEDADPGRWRTSERLKIIDGINPSRP
jgi:hypothetical protein